MGKTFVDFIVSSLQQFSHLKCISGYKICLYDELAANVLPNVFYLYHEILLIKAIPLCGIFIKSQWSYYTCVIVTNKECNVYALQKLCNRVTRLLSQFHDTGTLHPIHISWTLIFAHKLSIYIYMINFKTEMLDSLGERLLSIHDPLSMVSEARISLNSPTPTFLPTQVLAKL